MQIPFILYLEFWSRIETAALNAMIGNGLRYFLCVLISHNIWCCVVIGMRESVCIIGLSSVQKVIGEQIVSTKC